ncbi:hypothetical protein J7J26_01070 [Candidatus Micrarchaeota archaeon]|nr:hypothetical protein [Candidatus Micrarchaeota archaeon]
MGYKVKLISRATKDRIMDRLISVNLYQKKAEIHGTCIKFFTDNHEFYDMWQENFKDMPEYIRPHGRLFAISGDGSIKNRRIIKNKENKLQVLYEPLSKTVIIKNCDYYGWVKSIALGLVADFLEDFVSEHRRYSIHGSYIDHAGRGIGIIGPSGSGKTTLTYGLMLDNRFNFLTDDWFFVRLYDHEIRIFSSERNSYIRADLTESWPKYKRRMKSIDYDNMGRTIIDVNHLLGEDRIKQTSVLQMIVILKRDKRDKKILAKVSTGEAMEFMTKNDFCNPHQLIRTSAKIKKRKEFFRELFSKVPVYILNTVETPKQSLNRLKRLALKL